MDPVHVSARNYRNWRRVGWDIPEGCTAIVGRNGAGKSSLVNLVSVCLFGGRDLARSVTRGESDLEVALRFTHRGHRYDVRRWCQLGARAARTGVIFERDGEVVGAETIRATDEAITRTLGVERGVFHASSFLGQGEGAAWTRADPRERKRVLADVLGLGVWERVNAGATALLRERQVDAERLAATVDHLESLAGRGEWARDALAAAQARLAEARLQLDAQRVAHAARMELAEVRRELEEWEAMGGEPTVEERRLAARRGDLEVLQFAKRDLQHARRERDRLVLAVGGDRRALGVAQAATEAAAERLNRMRAAGGGAVCDVCGQRLPWDRLEERIVALQEAVADGIRHSEAAFGRVEVAEAELAEADRQVAVLSAAVAALPPEVAARIAAAAERVARWDALPAGRLDELRRRAGELKAAAMAADPMVHLGELQRQVEGLAGEVGREQAAVDAGDEAAARLAGVRAAALAGEGERRVLEVLVRASGRDGVPLRVIDAVALPRVSEVANRVLDGLGGGFRVELRATRATQRGELRDALDVVVAADGGEAVYEELSGGERTRVDVALRLGLASLLAARRGAEVGVLVVDEPEFLDAAGLERLAGVLRGGVGGAYRRVLVVSHVAGLVDAFDHTVRVEEEAGGPVLSAG